MTLRAVRRLPSLRRQAIFELVVKALPKTSRSWFRVLHFSVQADHVHLLVEADDRVSLARGVAGACIRMARAINRLVGRRGKIWGDRYHSRALRTPREVRNGIVYVLMNWKKHVLGATGFDLCSSAWWFDGWALPPSSGPPGARPVEMPRTWLLRMGWKRHGPIRMNERPRASLALAP